MTAPLDGGPFPQRAHNHSESPIALEAQRAEAPGTASGWALRFLVIGSCAGLGLRNFESRVLASIVCNATPRAPVVCPPPDPRTDMQLH